MRRARTSTLQLFLVAIGLAMVIRYTIQFFAGSQVRGRRARTCSRASNLGPFHLGALQALVLVVGVVAIAAVGLALALHALGQADSRALPTTWRWPRFAASTRAGP